MRFKKRLSIMLAIVLCIGALLSCAGCSSSSVTPSDAGAQESATADSNSTLVFAGENTDTINPVVTGQSELVGIVFSGLMKYDANSHPVEDLAESYTFNESTLTYTFKLRQGVLWQDGEPFTAKDVVFTYETLASNEAVTASLRSDYADILSVKATDDETIEIALSKNNAGMLGYFTIGIIPEHLLTGKDIATDSFNQNPVGTGRYKFVDWDTAGGMITFERNENYYDKVPSIKTLVYKTVANESTKALMLESGEADIAWLNAKYAEKFRSMEGYTAYDFRSADYRAVTVDFVQGFWVENKDSLGVLNYAIDKEAIVNSVLTGQGCVAYSPIQLNALGGNTKADIYNYDLDKFAEEMSKLGWKKGSDGIYERNGEKFHFTIQVRDYEEERIDIANIVSKQLKDAGVDMEIILVTKFDWNSGYNGFLAGNAVEFDADSLYKQFTTDGSSNSRKYSNTEVDRILKEARLASDPAKRKALYGQFEVEFAKNPPSIMIAYLDGNYVCVSTVKGLDTTRVLGHHAKGVMWNIKEWTISK